MSLLDGDIRAEFGFVFGEIFQDGTLHKVNLQDNGDGTYTNLPATPFPIKVQKDSCTEAMRLAPGYTEKSARFLILQEGVAASMFSPHTNDIVEAFGNFWDIDMITEDPAHSYWDMRASLRVTS